MHDGTLLHDFSSRSTVPRKLVLRWTEVSGSQGFCLRTGNSLVGGVRVRPRPDSPTLVHQEKVGGGLRGDEGRG